MKERGSPEPAGRLSPQLAASRAELDRLFRDCTDVHQRELTIGGTECLLLFVDGIVKPEEIQKSLLQPLMQLKEAPTPASLAASDLPVARIKPVEKLADLVHGVLNGSAALLVDGHPEALVIAMGVGIRRSVEEPTTEAVVRGPREGFTEDLRTNTGLVRLKIRSHALKMRSFVIGEQTRTQVVLAYLEGVAKPQVIEEAAKRLDSIKIDSILETGYIEELIEDSPFSPFPQLQYTERPDTVAAQLLEGRFAIFVDGTPLVLTAPVTFWQMMQASEDYYERFISASIIRLIRYAFLSVALFLPALYIVVTTFHHDMLPTPMMLSFASARERIPFPGLLEALMMELAFEALREAGVRLPRTVGQAVSILGALVIGQAAVEAGIVSAPMVIIVSLTGIASFTIPRYGAAVPIRLLRFPILMLGGSLGLFGLVLALVWMVLHLCALRSFGVPYLLSLIHI